jgi:hypothetical protein
MKPLVALHQNGAKERLERHSVIFFLRISVSTVERHVANIYAKIGARNRADATAYVWQHGLAQRPEAQ